MFTAVTLSMAFIATQSTTTAIARNVDRHAMARSIAEAGHELAISEVQANDDWRTDYTSGIWTLNSERFEGGSFRITGEDGEDVDGDGTVDGDGDLADDPLDRVTLTAVGAFQGMTHIVRAVVGFAATGGGGLLAAREKVQLMNDAFVDSWDSTAGDYATTAAQSAVVSTNSTDLGEIELDNFSKIRGDAFVGPGGNPTDGIEVGATAEITGTEGVLGAQVSIDPVSDPAGMPANEGDVTIDTGTTVISTDRTFDRLEIQDFGVLQVSGDVRVLCEDGVRVEDDGRIQVLGNGSLTIYSRETVRITDNAMVNVSPGMPSAVTIYMLGTSSISDRFVLMDDAQVYAQVHAANVRFHQQHDTHFYGTVSALEIIMNHDARLHHDLGSPPVGSVGTGAGDAMVRWVEQP